MRKQFKVKLRSCKMCKPHKMGWENRWAGKDRARLKEAEREIQDAAKFPSPGTILTSSDTLSY